MIPCGGVEPDAQGFVLAGGQSSRMGTDKGLVELNGRPLITYALETLRAAGLNASIAGARSDLSSFAPVIPDQQSDRGPLEGICGALAHSTAELALFMSVDLPLLPPSLLQFLLARARITGGAVTVVSVNGFPQTFPAVVRRDALPVLVRELAGGRTGCMRAFRTASAYRGQTPAALAVEHLVQVGQCASPLQLPAVRWFQNVNSPGDLARAESMLRASHSLS